MKLYGIPVQISAIAYIKAPSKRKARQILWNLYNSEDLEIPEGGGYGGIDEVSGRIHRPDMAEVTLAPEVDLELPDFDDLELVESFKAN